MLRKLTAKSGYVMGLVAMFVAGGAAAGVVLASVPDASGVIHGCRTELTGGIRVIDNASQTCRPGEAPLNWNQQGPQGEPGETQQIAYAHILVDPNTGITTLDVNRSKNIIDSASTTDGESGMCLQTSFTPHNAVGTDTWSGYGFMEIKDENGWSGPYSGVCDSVLPTANIFVPSGNRSYFILIH